MIVADDKRIQSQKIVVITSDIKSRTEYRVFIPHAILRSIFFTRSWFVNAESMSTPCFIDSDFLKQQFPILILK